MNPQGRERLLRTLAGRFERHMRRHEAVAWPEVLARRASRWLPS